MPKVPKFSDLTQNMPGMLDKVKSMIDSVTGSTGVEVAQQALDGETDPLRIKIRELDVLIKKFNDAQQIQSHLLHEIKQKYSVLAKELLGPEPAKTPEAEAKSTSKPKVAEASEPKKTQAAESHTSEQGKK